MLHLVREVRQLRKDGKLHRALITRTVILTVISAILAGVVLFNIFERGTDWVMPLGLAILGLFLGLFVFSRLGAVQWNEEKELIESKRLDRLGYVTLVCYIGFEIGLRTFLHDFYPVSATTFLLAGIFGVLMGRAAGTVIEVHRVYQAAHRRR